jgi:hypothetical protein
LFGYFHNDMNNFSLLNNRKIIDILIGDTKLFEQYGLPYMSGPQLCELCTSFGLSKTYSWGGGNGSRWTYMQSLLDFLNKQERVPELLSYLFNMTRFEDLNNLGDLDKVKDVYKHILSMALKQINSHLLIAKKELRIINNSFILSNIGEQSVIETPKVRVVTYQYIRELPERIKVDLNNKDYDSVITKSRTLLEEVLIYIIEQLTKERYKSNGDLIKIYQEATDLLNMRQKKEWDKRINELLGGLHKIVSAISSMRNINSDAHGVGVSRISISEREALLTANSARILAEYLLGVFENK